MKKTGQFPYLNPQTHFPGLPKIPGIATNSSNAWNFWEAGKNAFVDLNKEIVQFFSFLLNEIGRFPTLNAHPCFFMPPNKSRHFHY